MIGWLVFALGCGTTPPEPPAPPHFAGFDQLASQVARVQLDTARATARAVTEDEDASRVGAALGMLQVAEDPDEALDALTAAVGACRGCHVESGATRAAAPAWTHHEAAGALVERALWDLPAPASADPQVTAALAAWTGEDPLGSALRTCRTCHAAE